MPYGGIGQRARAAARKETRARWALGGGRQRGEVGAAGRADAGAGRSGDVAGFAGAVGVAAGTPVMNARSATKSQSA
jgi:hypothetical protein